MGNGIIHLNSHVILFMACNPTKILIYIQELVKQWHPKYNHFLQQTQLNRRPFM